MKFPGSHDFANQLLDEINPVEYKNRRNYVNYSTKLGPYITRGALTLTQVRDHTLNKFSPEESKKLIYELSWREYWQREWKFRGDAIQTDIKQAQKNVENHEISTAIIEAETGIKTIDQQINKLLETGFVHNHGRLWLAGLTCNIAKSHWLKPSKWMLYHLLDGDPASNSLSWQWVAGTFSSKKYVPTQQNINKFSDSNQTNTYIDLTHQELLHTETPAELKETKPVQLKWTQPKGDEIVVDPDKPTLLYHPFWINKNWHQEIDANKIMLLTPSWFEKWPISPKVTNFIIELAKNIEGMQIVVSEFKDLDLPNKPIYVEHQYTNQWVGAEEQIPLLFPKTPMRSFNSFSSFYKSCEKHSH